MLIVVENIEQRVGERDLGELVDGTVVRVARVRIVNTSFLNAPWAQHDKEGIVEGRQYAQHGSVVAAPQLDHLSDSRAAVGGCNTFQLFDQLHNIPGTKKHTDVRVEEVVHMLAHLFHCEQVVTVRLAQLRAGVRFHTLFNCGNVAMHLWLRKLKLRSYGRSEGLQRCSDACERPPHPPYESADGLPGLVQMRASRVAESEQVGKIVFH